MEVRKTLLSWPVVRQVTGNDPMARGPAAQSGHSTGLRAHTTTADRAVDSVYPYCMVGCGQKVFVKDGEVISIGGDPNSPVSRGRLCPTGVGHRAACQLPDPHHDRPRRRPHGTEWEHLDLETATDMIVDRLVANREHTWQDLDAHKNRTRRTLGVASLGGATLDNEENDLIKKFFTALGVVQSENQPRI